MQYKLFRIFLSLATSIILLGHSFVPHHHQEEHSSHHHHDHDHTGNNDQGLKTLFSHGHANDSFTTVQQHEHSQSTHQQVLFSVITHPDLIGFESVFKPARHSYVSNYVYASPHLVNLDFRGPPSQSV